MRLAGAIVIALLATIMVILPISVPSAAASTGHAHHGVSAGHGHGGGQHGETAEAPATCHDDSVGVGCGEHAGGSHGQGDACCGGVSCHSVQASAAPDVSSPVASAIPLVILGDEQVAGIVPGRLDRPPRTV